MSNATKVQQDQSFIRSVGDSLYRIDQVREQNQAGLNSFDYQAWPHLALVGDMAKLLTKYRRQITGMMGEDTYARIQALAQEYGQPMLDLCIEGDRLVQVLFGSRMAGEVFGRYQANVKNSGARFDPSNRTWGWTRGRVQIEQVENLVSTLMGFGIVFVGDLNAVRAWLVPAASATSTSLQGKDLVRVGKRDNRYEFSFSYHAELVQLFRNNAGLLSGVTEYDPNSKSRLTTDINLVDEAIAKIRALGFDVEESAALIADREARAEYERVLAEPIPEVAAQLSTKFKLFPFQNGGVRFLQRTEQDALGGLLAFEMGLGKTLTSLAYCVTRGYRVLVVGPKVTRRQWCQEAAKFFPSYFARTCELKTVSRETDLTQYSLVSTNYEAADKLSALLEAGKFDVLIIDESHNIKNAKTKRYQSIARVARNIKRRILLSGTAVKNKKVELFHQLELIKPGLYESAGKLKMDTIGGAWNRIQDIYLSKIKTEVVKDLPGKLHQIVEIEAGRVPDSPKDIGEVSRVKNLLAIAKAPATVEFVEGILDGSDSKVLVFSDSVEAATLIAEKLGDVALLHHGHLGDERRENIKSEFRNSAAKRVLVTTRQSLMTGANMEFCDRVVFNDLPWTAADVRQAEDRAHRLTSTGTVNVYWMAASNSVFDSNIAAIVMRKYELNRKVNEGKQVTAAERAWMEKPVSLAEALGKAAASAINIIHLSP